MIRCPQLIPSCKPSADPAPPAQQRDQAILEQLAQGRALRIATMLTPGASASRLSIVGCDYTLTVAVASATGRLKPALGWDGS